MTPNVMSSISTYTRQANLLVSLPNTKKTGMGWGFLFVHFVCFSKFRLFVGPNTHEDSG